MTRTTAYCSRPQIHQQSVVEARAHGREGAVQIRDYIGSKVCMWVRGRKITVKPFEGDQNILTMAGYCMKDRGLAHYIFASVNMTPEELRRARELYDIVRTSHEDGKKILRMNNITKLAWQCLNHHLRPPEDLAPANSGHVDDTQR